MNKRKKQTYVRRSRKKDQNEVGKRYFRVQDSIFKRTVHVLINYDHGEYMRWAQRYGCTFEGDIGNEHNYSGFSSVIDIKDKPSEWIIVLHSFNWCIQDQGTLVHEVTHTIVKIFKENNIPFNDHTQEFLAHNIGNMFEDIAQKLFWKRRSK